MNWGIFFSVGICEKRNELRKGISNSILSSVERITKRRKFELIFPFFELQHFRWFFFPFLYWISWWIFSLLNPSWRFWNALNQSDKKWNSGKTFNIVFKFIYDFIRNQKSTWSIETFMNWNLWNLTGHWILNFSTQILHKWNPVILFKFLFSDSIKNEFTSIVVHPLNFTFSYLLEIRVIRTQNTQSNNMNSATLGNSSLSIPLAIFLYEQKFLNSRR